jgi:transcriptional regulator with XRE-family HTH domain
LAKTIRQLGRLVRLRRRALGLTQEQLAQRCGLSTNHIARIEMPKSRENPSLETLEKLASGLEFAVSDLFQARAPKRAIKGIDEHTQARLLSDSVHSIRREHVELLIELAYVLQEIGKK